MSFINKGWLVTAFRASFTVLFLLCLVGGLPAEAGISTARLYASESGLPYLGEDFITKVHEARRLASLAPTCQYQQHGSLITGKQIRMAVLDLTTRKIFLLSFWEDPDGEIRETGVQVPDSRITVTKRKRNGINSDYTVSGPSRYACLAIKRPMREGDDIIQFVYTPFSQEIACRELVREGVKYLDGVINQAYAELDRNQIHSLAFPNLLVTRVVPAELVFEILMIEHVDPFAFQQQNSQLERINLMHRTLVLLGANRKDTYRFRRSHAGAWGLAQFTRPSWDDMRRFYPHVVTRPFDPGALDHLTAIKAQAMLLDYDLEKLIFTSDQERNQQIKRQWLANNPAKMHPFMAASYNTGPGRVNRSIEQLGHTWMDRHYTCAPNDKDYQQSFCSILPETLVYLKKFYFYAKFLGAAEINSANAQSAPPENKWKNVTIDEPGSMAALTIPDGPRPIRLKSAGSRAQKRQILSLRSGSKRISLAAKKRGKNIRVSSQRLKSKNRTVSIQKKTKTARLTYQKLKAKPQAGKIRQARRQS
ncbi:MAG: hypothetical protein HQK59_16095 [Deltaproteobacteria bacterium]|nr:hypothetical protein [Deltaproteobacteria bacterium]